MSQYCRYLFCGCAISAVVLGFFGSPAYAQSAFGEWNEKPGWLDDRERAEGRGFRVGDLELHPGLGAEVGWDSNVYYQDVDPQDSAVLRISPHLFLSTLGRERMEEAEASELPRLVFDTGISGSFYHFFIDEARDNLAGAAQVNLELNPKRPFSMRFYDQYSRTIRPFTDAERATDPYSFARDRNVAGLEAALFSPGRVLGGGLGYSFGIDLFEDDAFRFGDNLQHNISGNLSWRFLPQTAIVYETELYLLDYTSPDDASATSLLIDNERYHSRLGINGAITQQLSFSLFGGYAVGFYDLADDYDGLTAMAELRWSPRDDLKFSLGYDRDYFSSFIGNFYSRDRGYANAELMLLGSFLLGVEGDVGYYSYGIALAPDGALLGNQPYRDDIRVTARLFAEYRLQNWIAFSGSLGYSGGFTDFDYLVDAGTGGVLFDPAGFNKFEAWFGTRVFF